MNELTNEQIRDIADKSACDPLRPEKDYWTLFARAVIAEDRAQQAARHAEELLAYEVTVANLRAACDKFSEAELLRCAQAQPVATLHDDGYWTWKQGRPPYASNYAGWRMDVYAAPQAQGVPDAGCAPYLKDGEAPVDRIKREIRDTDAALTLLIREKKRTKELEDLLRSARKPMTEDQIDAAIEAWFANNIVAGPRPFSKRMQAALDAATRNTGFPPPSGELSRSMGGRSSEFDGEEP